MWQSQAAARRSRLPLSRCECIVYFAEAEEMCSDRRELCRLCKVYAFRASRSRPLPPWRGPKRSSTAPQCHRQPSRTNISRPRPLLFLHAHPKKQCHNARRRRSGATAAPVYAVVSLAHHSDSYNRKPRSRQQNYRNRQQNSSNQDQAPPAVRDGVAYPALAE